MKPAVLLTRPRIDANYSLMAWNKHDYSMRLIRCQFESEGIHTQWGGFRRYSAMASTNQLRSVTVFVSLSMISVRQACFWNR